MMIECISFGQNFILQDVRWRASAACGIGCLDEEKAQVAIITFASKWQARKQAGLLASPIEADQTERRPAIMP
jgi:hypothetical protein